MGRRGRPRCEDTTQSILNAAWRLIRRMPLKELSMEAIAKEAGVGKTTVYRRWPSKTAVVVDAFLERVVSETPFVRSERVADELAQQVRLLVRAYSGEYGRIVAQIVGQGQCDEEALATFRERFLGARRREAAAIIERGIESGEFRADLDPELAMDSLYGPIYYRLFIGHLPLDESFAAALPDTVLRGFLPH